MSSKEFSRNKRRRSSVDRRYRDPRQEAQDARHYEAKRRAMQAAHNREQRERIAQERISRSYEETRRSIRYDPQYLEQSQRHEAWRAAQAAQAQGGYESQRRAVKRRSSHSKAAASTQARRRPAKKPAAKWSFKKKLVSVFCVCLCVILLFFGGSYLFIRAMLGNVERHELDTEDLGLTEEVMKTPNTSVTNIALFGVDTRDVTSDAGRSDAVLILSVDRKHNKIKLISLARDTCVQIDGHGTDKLTHAYAYGGPQLAVKTLNQNFGMDIEDFVTVNFAQLASIIDYIGGVVINVTEEEREFINTECFDEQNNLGIETKTLEESGNVRLTGGQALAYARNRDIGSDTARAGRQREVLMAMFNEVKSMNFTKLPGLVGMVLSQCLTSLSDSEMMDIGFWGLTSNAAVEECGLPNSECDAYGGIVDGVWYFIYDLSTATDIIQKFIYDDVLPKE